MTLPVWQGLAAQESSGDITVLASPSVTVTDRTTGGQPNLFSDRDGNTGIGNPFTANADGSIEFYAEPGRYKVEATKGGETVTWDNQLIGTVHGAEHLWKLATVEIITVDGNASSPSDDAYSADLGGNLSADDTFIGRIANRNETTTPTFENTGGTPGALTITTRDGSVLWPGALEGDHRFQYEAGTSPETWLVLDPNPIDEDDMASDSDAAVPTQQSTAAFVNTFTAGHIDGLELSNNGTDADHDIDIATGVCSMRDGSGNRKLFELTSSLTKQIDANWAEGTDAGGFPSGLTLSADTWYHVFLIGKDDGSVDAGFDTSASASNLLTDASAYTWFRRIGSVLTDGSSNIIGFTQNADEFLWDATVNDYDVSNPGTAAVLRALSVPTGIKVRAIHSFTIFDGSPAARTAFILTSPDQDDVAPAGVAGTSLCDGEVENDAEGGASVHKIIRTDTSGQIRTRQSNSDAGGAIAGTTFGWIDDRGRNQ